MRTKYLQLHILFWLLLTAMPAYAQTTLTQNADEYFSALTALKQFNGSVLLKKDGNTILRKAYNMQTSPASSLWVSDTSQYDLRSVAKLFAKASIARMISEDRIDTSQSIHHYIPLLKRRETITVNQLLHHQSGLPREFKDQHRNYLRLAPHEIVNLIASEPLVFQPGSEQRYSNLGFQLIFYLIAQVSNMPYEQYLDQTFFSPLEMKMTVGHFASSNSRLTNYAYGHYEKDGEIAPVMDFEEDEFRQGHLFSSIDDLGVWADRLSTPPYRSFFASQGSIEHAGGTQGKRAYVYIDLKNDYQIIFLANYDGIPFQKVTEDLKALMEGKPYKVPAAITRKAVQVDPSVLSKYQGVYEFPEANQIKLTVIAENDTLKVYQNGQLAGPLYPESSTVFFWDIQSEESFVFKPDGESVGKFKVIMDFQGLKFEGRRIEGIRNSQLDKANKNGSTGN